MKHGLLSDAGLVVRHLFFLETVDMLREEFLHVRLLVVGLLPEHEIGQDAQRAVALQGAQADTEQGGHLLAGQPPFLWLHGLSVLILADVLRYLLDVSDQFLITLILPSETLYSDSLQPFSHGLFGPLRQRKE